MMLPLPLDSLIVPMIANAMTTTKTSEMAESRLSNTLAESRSEYIFEVTGLKIAAAVPPKIVPSNRPCSESSCIHQT